MSSAILARIAKLEERRRSVAHVLSKAERDALVRATLSDATLVIGIRERLLGPGNETFARNGVAAIMAGLRADT